MSTLCLILCAAVLGQQPASPAANAAEQLQALHRTEAAKWRMHLDETGDSEAKLNEKPIYIWTNPTRSGGQSGEVYLWLDRGRPVVIGSIFSHPELGQRMICHEFHSLAGAALRPRREAEQEGWKPAAPVEMLLLDGAPAVEESRTRRLIQMRALSKKFTAHSIDFRKERWELRLLPQPLYRYERPEGDVADGTIFAFVTSAGTDPEVVLVLEAREYDGKLAWHYRALRFSDSDLYVQYEGKEAFRSIRDDKNQLHFNADHTYRLIRDKAIAELPELVTETTGTKP